MICTWRWATVVSWLISGSIGLGRGQATSDLTGKSRSQVGGRGLWLLERRIQSSPHRVCPGRNGEDIRCCRVGAVNPPRRRGTLGPRCARRETLPGESSRRRPPEWAGDRRDAGSRRILVGFFEYVDDVLPGPGLTQETDEALVLQVSRDILQSSEMISRLVLRRNQQEKDVDRFAVEGCEIDPSPRQGDRADQARERGVPSMGDSDSHPDPRRAQFLTSEDGSNHTLHFSSGKMAGLVQALNHLPNRLFLAGCL